MPIVDLTIGETQDTLSILGSRQQRFVDNAVRSRRGVDEVGESYPRVGHSKETCESKENPAV